MVPVVVVPLQTLIVLQKLILVLLGEERREYHDWLPGKEAHFRSVFYFTNASCAFFQGDVCSSVIVHISHIYVYTRHNYL